MRILLLMALLVEGLFGAAQRYKVDHNSVVKDSSGKIYSLPEWTQMVMEGATLFPLDTTEYPAFLIRKVSDSTASANIARFKPMPSRYFHTGDKISSFTAKDIYGNKVSLKDLLGKVVVLNFWFIDCMPCRTEIPQLNDLADGFDPSDSVVFLAIGRDSRPAMEGFISGFHYRLVPDGRYIAQQYGIESYPTHVVLDKEGKVYFHTSGFSNSTLYWLRRSVNELLEE